MSRASQSDDADIDFMDDLQDPIGRIGADEASLAALEVAVKQYDDETHFGSDPSDDDDKEEEEEEEATAHSTEEKARSSQPGSKRKPQHGRQKGRRPGRTTYAGNFPTKTEIPNLQCINICRAKNIGFTLPPKEMKSWARAQVGDARGAAFYLWARLARGKPYSPPLMNEQLDCEIPGLADATTPMTIIRAHCEKDREHGFVVVQLHHRRG